MKMGCCFSCNDDDDQVGDSSERTQLLRDPVSNSTPVIRIPNSEFEVTSPTGEQTTGRGQEDELARILQETASAMIDVSGSGSHSLDQREFQERTRHYLQKVQNLSPSLLRLPSHLLMDVPHPEKHLSAPDISAEDVKLMEWAMEEVEKSLQSIAVEHSEDLVVRFGGQQAVAAVSD